MGGLTGIEEVFSQLRHEFRPFVYKHADTSSVAGNFATSSSQSFAFVNEALAAAREGDLSSASSRLREAGRLGLSREIGSLSWISFVSVFAAATSYLFYRLGNRDRAVACLQEANLADLLLMAKYGNLHQHLHRVRLAQHRAKIEWRLGDRAVGKKMVQELIDHLSGNGVVTTQPLRGSWDNRICLVCPSEMKNNMILVFKKELENWETYEIF